MLCAGQHVVNPASTTSQHACTQALEGTGKPVVLGGDLNVAHEEIDIFSPKTNKKSAGCVISACIGCSNRDSCTGDQEISPVCSQRFTPEERQSFAENYINKGFVDAFRRQYPDVVGYTYWSRRFPHLRAQNKGWRLDYWLVRVYR